VQHIRDVGLENKKNNGMFHDFGRVGRNRAAISSSKKKKHQTEQVTSKRRRELRIVINLNRKVVEESPSRLNQDTRRNGENGDEGKPENYTTTEGIQKRNLSKKPDQGDFGRQDENQTKFVCGK